MEIMDDLLDLKDALEDRLQSEKRKARSVLRGEGGFSTLITVLVIMAVGAIIITPLIALVVTGQRAGRTHNEVTDRLYAADTGMQDALWRINNDDLPSWMDGTWGTDIYQNPGEVYTLPYDVNGCQVQVTMRALWLLTGLETMPLGAQPHQEWVTFSNQVSPGHYQIVMLFDASKNLKMQRIGCWLPEGYDYIPESSNLEADDEADYYSIPTVSPGPAGLGGTVVVWEFGNVPFSSFPGDGSSRLEVDFSYTPTDKTINWTFSWSKALSMDIAVSWSADIKLFQIESTATHLETGHETTIVSAKMSNEALTTGTAVNGDYAATGNALVRDNDENAGGTRVSYYRETLYLDSPGTISSISSAATARRITVYWSGWKKYPLDVWYEDSQDTSSWSLANQQKLTALPVAAGVTKVRVMVTVGSDTLTIPLVEADSWQVAPNADNPSSRDPWHDYHPNGWSYSCQADITETVKEYFGPDFDGNATYTVGHAAVGAVLETEILQGVWGSSSVNVITVGASGTVEQYDGSSWSIAGSGGFTQDLNAIWGSDASHVYAVGANRSVRYYDGAGWSTIDSGKDALYGVWGTASDDVYVVGNKGIIRHWNGSSWTSLSTPWGTPTLRSVWGSSASDIFAVGMPGSTYCTILHSSDGTTWTQPWSLGPKIDLYGVWGTASNNVYAVGGTSSTGKIFRYNGATWAEVAPAGTNSLRGVWGSSASDVFTVGNAGTILHWNGASWSTMTSGTTANLYGVWGSSGTDVYAVGQGGAILHYDGSAWTKVNGGYNLYSWGGASHTDEEMVSATDYPLGDPAPARVWDGRNWVYQPPRWLAYDYWGYPAEPPRQPNYQGAYAAWSVVVIYSSPDTKGHQLYVFDTLRCWLHYQDKSFDVSNFLAPANVASDPTAARMTCFVGEGDAWTTTGQAENIYLNGYQLNTGAGDLTHATPANNVWNAVSNVMTPSPDGIDIDTFTISGGSGIIQPGDDTATLRMTTTQDVWMLVYVILSFRSDLTSSGVMSYIVK